MIDAVVLDAFGTIVRINRRLNPYRELIREGRRQGCDLTLDGTHFMMTTNLSLVEMASQLGIYLSPAKRQELTRALELELASIEPFPDALEAVARLQGAGVRLGICSNLASPYGPVIKELFPNFDGYAFSYEVGAIKPDPVIYQSICSQMDVEPGHHFGGERGRVLMIGDSKRCDQDGPRLVGMMGLRLDRNGNGPIKGLLQFAEMVINQNLKVTRTVDASSD
ncbi:HAD family hydrolase [Pseudomonas syringae]|uniref:HAD family hydrolase n=1 Tax=Pseudomonas syringae TaxID=317 RepID=UPI000760448E|nr:HAD family hydrolase [Pseudomonas syringae]KWS28947.1 haloacid dehalogenase [Pseudomonas syringae pv. syringae]MCH5536730.1 HAD family hydrolase [Pseudomonas syringae pv. syringae]MDF5774792.1 HAD family hydrolase [Pseudomonas syringae pv. syringae]MDY2562276.1 HAD family hydrolase [Pseudomonas syringae]